MLVNRTRSTRSIRSSRTRLFTNGIKREWSTTGRKLACKRPRCGRFVSYAHQSVRKKVRSLSQPFTVCASGVIGPDDGKGCDNSSSASSVCLSAARLVYG